MDQNLAAGLARALNLSPADAERAVAAIGRQLRERLEAGGHVRIDGLGTFHRTETGLAFEPAPPLAAAVNHRFAGLPSVPAPVGGFRTKATDSREEDPFERVQAGPVLNLPPEEEEPPLAPVRDLSSPSHDDDPSRDDLIAKEETDRRQPGEDEPDAHDDDIRQPGDDEGRAADAFDVRHPDEGEPVEEDESAARQENGDEPVEEYQTAFRQPGEDLPHEVDAPPTAEAGDLTEGPDAWAAEDEDAWSAFPEMPLISDDELLTQDDLDAASGVAANDPPQTSAPDGDWQQQPDDGVEQRDQEGRAGASGDRVDEEMGEEGRDADAVSSMPPPKPSGDDDENLDALLEGVWTPRTGPADDDDHPLGPPPADLLEDADFQVLEGGATPNSEAEAPLPPPPPFPADDAASRVPDAEPPPADGPPTPRASAPGFEASRAPAGPDAERPRRRRWPWVVALLALVFAGGALAWMYLQPDPTPADPVAATPPPPVAPPAEEPAEEAAEEPPPEEETPPPSPPADDRLRSPDPVDPAGGGYSWVISEASQAAAQQRMQRYRQQGYRVAVIPATVRGATYYRVAIGQFDSRADAEALRNQLPPDAPTDIWILAL